MKLLSVIILVLMLSPCRVWAQDDTIAMASTALQGVLSDLKGSVDKLRVNNDQLVARDNAMKTQVLQLQAQLADIKAQGDSLNKSTAKLHEINTRRAEQIADLEDENTDLDNRSKKAQDAIRLIQQSLDAGYQEDQQLLLRLKDLDNALPAAPAPPSLESQAFIHRQKEKLKLMKMIEESEARQEALHQSILDFQKNALPSPAASVLAQQQLLKGQIKDLEAQMAAYPVQQSTNVEYNDRLDQNQLFELQEELKSLEKNYAQLKDLAQQMSQKTQKVGMTVDQHVEGAKLQGSLDDLDHQAQSLKADLDDLRSEMVDLDKRKSHLEEMIQH